MSAYLDDEYTPRHEPSVATSSIRRMTSSEPDPLEKALLCRQFKTILSLNHLGSDLFENHNHTYALDLYTEAIKLLRTLDGGTPLFVDDPRERSILIKIQDAAEFLSQSVSEDSSDSKSKLETDDSSTSSTSIRPSIEISRNDTNIRAIKSFFEQIDDLKSNGSKQTILCPIRISETDMDVESICDQDLLSAVLLSNLALANLARAEECTDAQTKLPRMTAVQQLFSFALSLIEWENSLQDLYVHYLLLSQLHYVTTKLGDEEKSNEYSTRLVSINARVNFVLQKLDRVARAA